MIFPCGSCLTAEFADDDSEDDETFRVRPGGEVGHLRRPASSEPRGTFAKMVHLSRGGKPYTYCGKPIGDDWTEAPR